MVMQGIDFVGASMAAFAGVLHRQFHKLNKSILVACWKNINMG